jgi:hypothetical protein
MQVLPERGWSVAAAIVMQANQSYHGTYASQPKDMCRAGWNAAQPLKSAFAKRSRWAMSVHAGRLHLRRSFGAVM